MRLKPLSAPRATALAGAIVRTGLQTLVVSVLVVTGLSRASQARFPLWVPDWSGKTLLIVNEESFGEPIDEGRNLIALPILNDGTVNPKQGIALANSTVGNQTFFSGDPDPVAVTPNGHFAYVQEEDNEDSGLAFYRFDLQHVDTNGGSGHIKRFQFNESWQGTGLAVLGNFLYAVVNSDGKELWRMAINPINGNLGAPSFVVTIDDGSGHEAMGSDVRLTTDGTCIFASDSGSEFVFKICGTVVSLWADASTGGDAPNIMTDNTIVFGPNNGNLFLSQNNEVFTTTGPSGITPGSFSKIFDLPGGRGTGKRGLGVHDAPQRSVPLRR
jgi:DNA-binding beta-propeller fold protein YncE